MLDEKIVRHILSLSSFAEDAIAAMQSKNEAQLKTIIEETKKLHEEIEQLQKIIYEDVLTKSRSRKWFEDFFLDATKERFNQMGILVMIDIDHFKSINDTYGHIIGDKVLIHLVQKLKECHAEVVRFGGDEFLILFDASTLLSSIEQKIHHCVDYFKKVAFKVDKTEFKVSFSYGVASFKEGDNYDRIIEHADKTMYASKKTLKG
jgi:diguanylate cyclase (GGDEF)-like protein